MASLPGASVSSILRRNDEGDAATSAYQDGPIEIMPGIWLGSEDNARDWPELIKRGIRSILNVAKEVVISFDSSHPAPPARRNTASAITLHESSRHAQTYQPAHLPSGRPPMHYLKLPWSHGQADLVRTGFAEGFAFVDAALARREGVLIHCQCGVSRSATMTIAYVMRAASQGGPSVPPEVLALNGKGMQAAYDYVQQRSNTIGPNMSLIYQLLDYERALKGGDSPTPSSKGASEDEEWERRRLAMDSPEPESQEILREAKELDREMEERRARKLSLASSHSNSTNATGFTGAVGNGAPWRTRYGSGVYNRSRATSMGSSVTSRSSVSIVSEDILEEEEEFEHRDPEKVTTPDTDATDEDTHCFGLTDEQRFGTRDRQQKSNLPPPSAPATKTSFGTPTCPPSASAYRQTFMVTRQPPSSSRPRSGIQNDILPTIPSPVEERPKETATKKEKRRPPPLSVSTVVPFPLVQVVADDESRSQETAKVSSSAPTQSAVTPSASRTRRLSQRISSMVPFPVKTALAAFSSGKTPTVGVTPTPSASQTLFVFPPSPRTRGVSTPSTVTITSTPLLTPSFGLGIQTPRAGLFRKRTDSRKSWIGLSAVTPTTATARVDARGLFGDQ